MDGGAEGGRKVSVSSYPSFVSRAGLVGFSLSEKLELRPHVYWQLGCSTNVIIHLLHGGGLYLSFRVYAATFSTSGSRTTWTSRCSSRRSGWQTKPVLEQKKNGGLKKKFSARETVSRMGGGKCKRQLLVGHQRSPNPDAPWFSPGGALRSVSLDLVRHLFTHLHECLLPRHAPWYFSPRNRTSL